MTTERALNLGELAKAFGYSRAQLRRMGLRQSTLPGGKMLPSVFRKYLEQRCNAGFVRLATKVADASPVLKNDLRTLADKLSAPRTSSVRRDASRLREASQPRSTELQTSPA